MADISKAFSVENGISLNDEVGIFDGAADPSISGEAAPLGSLYIRLNGQLFQKTGSNLTDWSKFALGASGLLNVSATDTTPGFLNSKLTFTSEFVKTVLNPNANESISVSLANSGVTAGTYKSLTVNSKGIVTAVSALNGGTGLSGVGGADNLLCTNTAANGLEYRTLSAGSGISISQGTGSITISATAGAGVSSLAGTANQISASAPTGSVTLSLASNPTIPGVQKLTLPVGATADRPSFGATGDIRYNSTLGYPEIFNNTNWVPLGRVLQDLSGSITSTSGTGLIPMDTTIPQVTEGFQILSVAITPVSTASKIRFRTSFTVSAGTAGRYVTAALFLNGAANAVGAATSYIVTVNTGNVLVLEYEMNNFDLNVKTFTLRLGANSAATSYIGRAGANTLGGVFTSTYNLSEIK